MIAQQHTSGLVSELHVASYFASKGYEVFTPLLPQSKTDLIVKYESEIELIQVKTLTEVTSGNYTYLQVRLQGKERGMYSEGDFTLLACFHLKHGLWLIPYEKVKDNKSLTLCAVKPDGSLGIRKRAEDLSKYKVA